MTQHGVRGERAPEEEPTIIRVSVFLQKIVHDSLHDRQRFAVAPARLLVCGKVREEAADELPGVAVQSLVPRRAAVHVALRVQLRAGRQRAVGHAAVLPAVLRHVPGAAGGDLQRLRPLLALDRVPVLRHYLRRGIAPSAVVHRSVPDSILMQE